MLTPIEAREMADRAHELVAKKEQAKKDELRARLEAREEYKVAMRAPPELEEALKNIEAAASSGHGRRRRLRFGVSREQVEALHASGQSPEYVLDLDLKVAASVYGRALRTAIALRERGWDCDTPHLPYAPHDEQGLFGAACSFEVRF